jgi:hypothetical protein
MCFPAPSITKMDWLSSTTGVLMEQELSEAGKPVAQAAINGWSRAGQW